MTTLERPMPPRPPKEPEREKDREAVERGRLGGLKGGPARRDALLPEERREIAKKAARARWANRDPRRF